MPTASLAGRNVVRWGILGCGDVTEVKSGPGFQKAARSQLVAVMRRNGALAQDYARRHGVPRWYDDARALVNDPEVDAVYVATPPGAHLEGVLLAAAAGKPVYVEKPMARHTPECDAMIAACARAAQKLFVAYYRRAMPRFVRVKELLDGGAIGALTAVSYRLTTPSPPNFDPTKKTWRLDATDSGGGLFLDVGSHALDLIDFYCGPLPLASVHGEAARLAADSGVEDAVTMTFRTAAGVPGAALFNFASTVREDVMELTGTKGRITFGVYNHERVKVETADDPPTYFEYPVPQHIAQDLIQTVVDDLLGRGRCPSTGESGRRTSAVMDRALEGYYSGRADAFWTRPQGWSGNSQR